MGYHARRRRFAGYQQEQADFRSAGTWGYLLTRFGFPRARLAQAPLSRPTTKRQRSQESRPLAGFLAFCLDHPPGTQVLSPVHGPINRNSQKLAKPDWN